jgi:cytochrome c biogenesis factor
MKREMFLLAILVALFVPIVSFAQSVGDIVSASSDFFITYVAPILVYVVVFLVKKVPFFANGSKGLNFLIALVVAACFVGGYFAVGAPKLNWIQVLAQLFGSATAIWGFIKMVSDGIYKDVPAK